MYLSKMIVLGVLAVLPLTVFADRGAQRGPEWRNAQRNNNQSYSNNSQGSQGNYSSRDRDDTYYNRNASGDYYYYSGDSQGRNFDRNSNDDYNGGGYYGDYDR
jgi:hypothetical protein